MTTLAAPWFLPLLFVTGLTAGWVNAITGGGGLVVLPVFLALGIPPHLALGTNMLQSSAGTLAAAYTFIRQQQVDFRTMRLGMVWTLVGASGGARAVQRLDPTGLKTLLPFVPAGIVLYTICCPQVGSLDAPPRMSRRMFYLLAGLGLGFFDGFLGAGAGTLWALAFVMGLGFHLAKATAYTKEMNATSNVAAFMLFLSYGSVWLVAGLIMALGQVIGEGLGHIVSLKGGQESSALSISWWSCCSCSNCCTSAMVDRRDSRFSALCCNKPPTASEAALLDGSSEAARCQTKCLSTGHRVHTCGPAIPAQAEQRYCP